MFRITEDPSSGILVQCLAKNYKNESIVSVVMDKVGVMAAYSDPLCVCVVHCIILILSTCYILCSSWIVGCLIIIDARCKHEDWRCNYFWLLISKSTTPACSSIGWQYLKLSVQLCASDDGRKNRPKHVEPFRNK